MLESTEAPIEATLLTVIKQAIEHLDPVDPYEDEDRRTPALLLKTLGEEARGPFPLLVIAARDGLWEPWSHGNRLEDSSFETWICPDTVRLVDILAALALREFDIDDSDEVKVFRLAARPRLADGDLYEHYDGGQWEVFTDPEREYWKRRVNEAVACAKSNAERQREVKAQTAKVLSLQRREQVERAELARLQVKYLNHEMQDAGLDGTDAP